MSLPAENTFARILDEVFSEEGLKDKALLLDTDYPDSRRKDSVNGDIEVICNNDKSHIEKLTEGF